MTYAGWIELTIDMEGDGRRRVFVRKDAVVAMSEAPWTTADGKPYTSLHFAGDGGVTVSEAPEEVFGMLYPEDDALDDIWF